MVHIIWSITDLAKIISKRIDNKFDANIGVSGARGNGKSTFITKLFYRFPKFKPWKHQVYTREDVMKLLEEQKRGLVFDDEAINSGYKRDFFNQAQKKLVKMVNMYRDNFNIYASAIPKFYALDKDLRDLIKIHIHIIGRGVGVLHMAKGNSIYSDDVWDVSYNKKVEEKWNKKVMKNPDFKPKYELLTTFKGYIQFNDVTAKQRALYELIKKTKRKIVYEKEISDDKSKEENFYDKVLSLSKEGRMNKEQLLAVCITMNKKYNNVVSYLNNKLKNEGSPHTLRHFLEGSHPLPVTTTVPQKKVVIDEW